MSVWKPDRRTHRIVVVSVWAFILEIPVLACFYPSLWETYFIVLITGLLGTLPFWWGHLFRLKSEETDDVPSGDDRHTGPPTVAEKSNQQRRV